MEKKFLFEKYYHVILVNIERYIFPKDQEKKKKTFFAKNL